MDNYSVMNDPHQPTRRLDWSRVGNIIVTAVAILLCSAPFFIPGYFIGLLMLGEEWRHPDFSDVVVGYLLWGCVVGLGLMLGIGLWMLYDYICPTNTPLAQPPDEESPGSSTTSQINLQTETGPSQEV